MTHIELMDDNSNNAAVEKEVQGGERNKKKYKIIINILHLVLP